MVYEYPPVRGVIYARSLHKQRLNAVRGLNKDIGKRKVHIILHGHNRLFRFFQNHNK